MKLVYFSWVRERIGAGEEEVDLPPEVTNVGELLAWQKSRGPEYEAAFEHEKVIRVALDKEHVGDRSEKLSGVSEAAFFPPMTGG